VTEPQTDLAGIYARRFTDRDARAKDGVWTEIGRYLQQYIPEGLPVLDVACDRGYFICHIASPERWATDARDVAADLPPDVRFVQADGLALRTEAPTDYFGTVFMSNYLEHLPSPAAVVEQLAVARDLLREGGRVIVLQPNIRLVGAAYWDFIDHKVALTDRSLVEAAESVGFRTLKTVVRFLPYTTKSRLPQHPALVRAYLAFRPAQILLGRQTLYVGERE
jgi:SAM-dependent methyltransferase